MVNPLLIQLLSDRAGCDVTTARGANVLRLDIEKATGEYISINTIKRIVGLLVYDGNHREQVKDVIARYLGFSSWELLEAYLANSLSDFNTDNPFMELSSLPEGRRIALEWEPDRRVVLRHLEGSAYLVEESLNAKIEKGDIVSVSHVAVGFPFYASDVVRNGKSIGNYTAASRRGIVHIELV